MRTTVFFIVVAAIAVAPDCGLASTRGEDPHVSPDFAAIDAYVEERLEKLRVPGAALAIVRGDRTPRPRRRPASKTPTPLGPREHPAGSQRVAAAHVPISPA